MNRITRTIKRRNEAAGFHFFKQDTMRFFNSRIVDRTANDSDPAVGIYFITSEQYEEGHPRLYTVRVQAPGGRISTVGKFQGHSTEAEAVIAMEKVAGYYKELSQDGPGRRRMK